MVLSEFPSESVVMGAQAGSVGPALTALAMNVDPGLAQRWLTMTPYDQQRTLREPHVQMLARAIRRGEFKPGTIEFHHCAEKGDRAFLTDGQHRLNAIARAGLPVEMIVVRRYVATYAEVQAAYSRTDRGLGRTHGDVYVALGLPQEIGLNRQQCLHFGAAMVHIIAGFQPYQTYNQTRSGDLRAELMREWATEARLVFESYEGVHSGWRRALTRSMPLALALVTVRYQAERAVWFWDEVARGEGLSAGQPTHSLREFLNDAERARRKDQRMVMWAIARAWNAYYSARPLTVFKGLEPKKPLELFGTPYDGKRLLVIGE